MQCPGYLFYAGEVQQPRERMKEIRLKTLKNARVPNFQLVKDSQFLPHGK